MDVCVGHLTGPPQAKVGVPTSLWQSSLMVSPTNATSVESWSVRGGGWYCGGPRSTLDLVGVYGK